MAEPASEIEFGELTEFEGTSPMFIEGTPGFGLVTVIAVDQLTKH